MPPVTSSGPDLVAVFSSSPYGSPASSSPFAVAGFQLEVDIRFLTRDTLHVTRDT